MASSPRNYIVRQPSYPYIDLHPNLTSSYVTYPTPVNSAPMMLSAQPSCPVCCKQEKLLLCKACKVQQYCGREHQMVDRDNHKKACKDIKKAQQDLDEEEQKLRAFPGDFMTPANVFDNSAGHFWGILGTRPYSEYCRVLHLMPVVWPKEWEIILIPLCSSVIAIRASESSSKSQHTRCSPILF